MQPFWGSSPQCAHLFSQEGGPSEDRAAVHVDMCLGGTGHVPMCPVQHMPPALTHSHGQVRVLRLARGAYYSLLVFLSV